MKKKMTTRKFRKLPLIAFGFANAIAVFVTLAWVSSKTKPPSLRYGIITCWFIVVVIVVLQLWIGPYLIRRNSQKLDEITKK